ncbi:MarR family winged helix-turn-helix transcriptional regulator [Fischerella sp. PCC 9605]|uniref:MarR family winged helix-turn-helix transcriptional regulator n=1 Tax=Fischerella sp. PCC 9605 TaxID=1173024 RepID=UPI0004B7D108|nr:MarR family transcriptional regulator [Fischerella sp. PCC 9605]
MAVIREHQRTLNLLGALALGLSDRFQSAVEASTGHGGETPAALVTLGMEPGISINTLRQILKLSHPGTVRLIDRLEKDGFVERRAGADGRTLALFLTEAGQQRRKEILAQRRQQLQLALDCLTEQEQQQLTTLVEKMLTAITTDETQSDVICRLCEIEVCPQACCPVGQQHLQYVAKA